MKQKFNSIFVCLVVASTLSLAGCKKDDIIPKEDVNSTQSEQKLEGQWEQEIEIALEGDANLDVELTAPKTSDKEEARYLSTITKSTKKPINFKFSQAEINNPKNLRIFIVQGVQQKFVCLTMLDVKPTIKETKDPKCPYKIYYSGKVKLVGHKQSFKSSDWYVSAVYGDTSYPNWNDSSTTYVVDENQPKEIDFNLPLVAPWTKLETRIAGHDPLFGRQKNLSFTPDGVLLRVDILSDLIENVPIKEVRLEGTQFMGLSTPPRYEKPDGTLTLEDLIDGAKPRITETPISDSIVCAPINGGKLAMLPGGARRSVYKWTYPRKDHNQAGKATRVYVPIEIMPGIGQRLISIDESTGKMKTQAVDSYDTYSEIPADQTELPNETNKNYRNNNDPLYGYRKQLLPIAHKYDMGKTYVIPATVTSDLMISEYYTHPADDPSLLYGQGGEKGFSVVEIYNPTRSDIDLSNYGLIRLAHPKGSTTDGAYEMISARVFPKIQQGGLKVWQEPSNHDPVDELFSAKSGSGESFSAFGIHNQSIAPVKWHQNTIATRGGRLGYALVQPLDGWGIIRDPNDGSIKGTDGFSPKWRPSKMMLLTYIHRDPNVADPRKALSVKKLDVNTVGRDYVQEGYSTLRRGLASCVPNSRRVSDGGPNMLGPDQTAIILSSGYTDSRLPMNRTELSQDTWKHGAPYVFSRVQTAASQGYCKYVIALNNAKVKEPSARYTYDPDGATNDYHDLDVPILVRLPRNPVVNNMNVIVDGPWSAWQAYKIHKRYGMDQSIRQNVKGVKHERKHVLKLSPPLVFNQSYLTNPQYLNRSHYINHATLGVAEQRQYTQKYDANNYKKSWSK
ncbi:hypothetical protein [Porphyromonas sp. COT-290 OH3588]|uniref:hypothetical protein n=1 Tax=Porphyromonas sp. COT-290 OH3588 TaxID=1515617 RepID=UPI00052E2816|nr:hypothetical protein [Porphyromonas sp. COT-290 OH3588]KGN98841.1 hypothetical protein HQ48_07505 [Porphyromonas sp. COT-290 OH3588]